MFNRSEMTMISLTVPVPFCNAIYFPGYLDPQAGPDVTFGTEMRRRSLSGSVRSMRVNTRYYTNLSYQP